ncbi:prepilin-type N-terminal cleavage/methylation domain-containing protein [Tumebacillus sp. ITR2]|uniref:Prepilin-type N-terminal cleavage/methylation domain-containing protein n=1 Tax=Tumebacillus amylolyticus TaxID=2801339 RepID=A0ABS1J9S6_9BACL|nr:prepilin-type N-terminal cleavage/methylation domain-containing protein [Tumebacillus amylolyticus]MBL0387031.1 prepilin-type N-terminal cleavage/methylation domain-containing protein [Tumebacillus amylolyticus]
MSKTGPLSIGKKIWQDNQGLTLLELLLALTIWGLLLPVIAGGLLFTVQTYTREVERLEAREQALAVLRKVEGEVRAGHNFSALSDGLSFQDAHDHLIQYQLNLRTNLLQRVEQGVGSTIIGARVTRFTCTLSPNASYPTLALQLRTQAGRTSLDISEVLIGRGSLP